MFSLSFFLTCALLGVGLAMDAFSVSLANGLREPEMKWGRMSLMAGTFGFFQFIMPVIGWFCVHTMVTMFRSIEPFIPWIAMALLGWIGGKMILEGIRGGEEEGTPAASLGMLMMQGVATSIDALSVGFTIAEYSAAEALVSALVIAAVTFAICVGGLLIGRKFGVKLAGKASVLGGVILVAIGLRIVISALIGA